MAEKKSHQEWEQSFGGAIPRELVQEFFRVVRTSGGFQKKRAIAAAVLAFIEAASADKAVELMKRVNRYYPQDFPVTPPPGAGTTGFDLEAAASAELGKVPGLSGKRPKGRKP